MNILKILVLGVNILIYNILFVNGNSDCAFISDVRHQVTAKDFKVTSVHKKYVMCGAYFCSQFPTVLPLQLTIHEINSTKDNLAVYLEKSSITTINNCGHCKDDALKKVEDDSTSCQACPVLEPSKTVDIYVRLEKSSNFNESNEDCSWNINFNMSVQEYACDKGLATNIPQSNQCNATVISSSDLQCISPTCSKNIMTKNDTDNFIHTFLPSNTSSICIWELPLEPLKTVDITFSPIIKKHLTIYEDNLLNPKWNLRHCKHVNDHVRIKSAAKKILILYKNDRDLPIESFLQVNITRESCSFPPDIKNGLVDLKGSGNETVARYVCFENYHLVGDENISCNEKLINPPQCISDKEKTDSIENDVPRSNISLIELDTGTFDSTRISTEFTTLTNTPVEGSGSRLEDENGFSDMSDSESGTPETLSESELDDLIDMSNSSLSGNNTMGPPWHTSEGGLVLFSLPSLEDKLILLIIIGVGVLLFAIVTVTCLIFCRNRSIRSGLNRKFDTFQNPIYEKPVVRVPIPNSDSDPSHEKLDLGDLSDSTVLD